MVQKAKNEVLVEHRDDFAVANRDLRHRVQALLREDLVAQQDYQLLARKVADPAADVVFDLLVRETEERRILLQRIIDGTLDGLVGAPSDGRARLASDAATRFAAGSEALELARAGRRHADQLRDLACSERGRGHAPLGAILDALGRDSDKHASLLIELSHYLCA
jgi:hypothetical protein